MDTVRMREKMKKCSSVSIIGGADGPTSVFLVGKWKKKPLRERVRQFIYQYRRRRAKKSICAAPHTLEELVDYANKRYFAAEIPKTKKKYIEQYASAKEGLIIMQRPDLLDGLGEIARPDVWKEETAREMLRQIQIRSERIAQIPDEEMPMDFHIYEIRIEGGWMEMEIDYQWDIFSMSYSGDKKSMKALKEIVRDLYVYYGVSGEDIKNETKRYSALLNVLSCK